MKVTLDFKRWTCHVEREDHDPRFTRTGWSDGRGGGTSGAESTFLYHVKQELIKQGYDVIKKRMWKDGHMVDDTQQYIRSRHWERPGAFCIYNGCYALYDLGERFNQDGQVDIRLELMEA